MDKQCITELSKVTIVCADALSRLSDADMSRHSLFCAGIQSMSQQIAYATGDYLQLVCKCRIIHAARILCGAGSM